MTEKNKRFQVAHEDIIKIPDGLKQLYEEVKTLIGHRVQLNLRTMVHTVIEGTVKNIIVTPSKEDLEFVLNTSEGEKYYTVKRGCQGWEDLGDEDNLKKIEKAEAETPSDIKNIKDAEVYLNKIQRGEYALGYDEECADLGYLAKQLKKAIEEGVFTWEQLGKVVSWGKNEKNFNRHIDYLRGYSVKK